MAAQSLFGLECSLFRLGSNLPNLDGLIKTCGGKLLAKRLGFPTEQQARLQMEQQSASKALIAHNPWRYTDEGSGLTLASDFRCDTVLGYDDFIDALQAAGGSERAALAAVGRTAQGTK